MSRYFAVPLLVLCVVGCNRDRDPGPSACKLVLDLPESQPLYNGHVGGLPKLTVDGKDVKVEAGAAKQVEVKVDARGGRDITIVYSFWPYSYSNTIRTKVVALKEAQEVKVDFNIVDEGRADSIIPIYVPTPHEVVAEMCKMAKVGQDDVVFDIGCGDGRLVIHGVKEFGAKKGVGVDIDKERIAECEANARKAGVSDRVEFRNEDALKLKDLSEATVVLLYVGEDFGKALEPVLRQTLKPGARIVSHRFPLGDWKPDVEKAFKAKNNSNEDEDYRLKMWTIP